MSVRPQIYRTMLFSETLILRQLGLDPLSPQKVHQFLYR